jgi:uncharacterized protein (DUF1697 family)
MAELRELFTSLGFIDVQTYIQSGNVVFKSAVAPVPVTLREAILRRFDVVSDVIVLRVEALGDVADRLPFDASEPTQIHVGFAAEPISTDLIASIDTGRFMPERCVVYGAAIYLDLPNGMGKARLPAYLDRRFKQPITYRNWATLNKLLELASSLEERSA